MKIIIRAAVVFCLSAVLFQGCATPQVVKQPDEMYKDGEEFFRKGDYEDAITQWKKVKESYHSPELSAKAEIGIADAYFLNDEYIEAAAEYENFRKLHPLHERAGHALYRQGMSYYHQINRIDTDQTPVKNALAIFESYAKLYPAGESVAEVTEKIRDCRDKQLQYEIYVGKFYLKNDKYPAAIARFEEALKRFADLPRRDELLYRLGLAYREGGQQPKGRETFERLLRDLPEFRFGKRGFFLLARKSRDCAEAYVGTPHKQDRRLTPPGGKSALSGRKLANSQRLATSGWLPAKGETWVCPT
ncbi:MAG: outer membrane protein assembly factor BamD [Deltaproteobacteria bacterium]|nr:outer membrane protein assembly factor BamD [Deltaproteobacteria bacterium]